jgi:RND family efflux transporter MFP subunit
LRALRVAAFMLKTLLPLLVLAVSGLGGYWLIKTRPKPERRPPRERAIVVTATVLQRSRGRVVTRTTGTVIPARAVTLQARVTGEVRQLNAAFLPGGLLTKGDTVVQLDSADYELAVTAREADVVKAEYEYKLELGHQDVARYEWELLDNKADATDLDLELALRKPHLRNAEARVKAAKAALRSAELDLARTRVQAPFNGVVRSRDIELGALVTPQAVLGDLVGTDEYWVDVAVAVDELRWISLPEEGRLGARVRLLPAGGIAAKGEWEGRVLRRRPGLQAEGRLARLLVSVPDPLRTDTTVPLLLGAFVRVEIEGPLLDDVFALSRAAVHEGDTVWLADADDRLEFRQIDPLWQDQTTVFVREGLEPGERLITSGISAPAPGMRLQVEGDTTPQAAGRAATAADTDGDDTDIGGNSR